MKHIKTRIISEGDTYSLKTFYCRNKIDGAMLILCGLGPRTKTTGLTLAEAEDLQEIIESHLNENDYSKPRRR